MVATPLDLYEFFEEMSSQAVAAYAPENMIEVVDIMSDYEEDEDD